MVQLCRCRYKIIALQAFCNDFRRCRMLLYSLLYGPIVTRPKLTAEFDKRIAIDSTAMALGPKTTF